MGGKGQPSREERLLAKNSHSTDKERERDREIQMDRQRPWYFRLLPTGQMDINKRSQWT